MARWCVTSMVRAPRAHLERFVRHYLELGADRIYLFHDDPAWAEPIAHRKVKNVICDDDYWKGNRPPAFEPRQRANATKAFQWTDADWLLHCDHDEFIQAPAPVGDLLDAVGENVMSVLAPPIEAVYDAEPDFDTCFETPWFKRPMKVARGYHPAVWAAFGSAARLTSGGLMGHLRGKSFTRRALYSGRIPVHLYGTVPEGLVGNVVLPGLYVMHFDSLTFADWREKHLRRIEGRLLVANPPELRVRQWEAIVKARDRAGDEGLRELYGQLNVLSAEKIVAAQKAGFVLFVDRSMPQAGPVRPIPAQVPAPQAGPGRAGTGGRLRALLRAAIRRAPGA